MKAGFNGVIGNTMYNDTNSHFGMTHMSTQNYQMQGGELGGLGLLNQLKDELSKPDLGGYVPRKKRLQENKESLATQKLLYPSKFRKDPYR